MVLTVHFEFHCLKIENDVGYVLNDPGQCGELVLRTLNCYCGDRCAFERRKQDTSEAVPNGVAVAGFERLGYELCIGICGCALIFRESLRHFKTTVTDWHILISDRRLPVCDLKRERRLGDSPYNRKSTILNLAIPFAGFPLASAASHPAMETQGPTA